MIKQLDGILEVVNNCSKSTDKPGYSIEEVMQVLEGMHEVVHDDELFMKSADIFTERKIERYMSSSSNDSNNTNNSTDGSDDEFYQLVSASCVTAVSEWLKMEHVFKDLLETLKRDYGLKRIGDTTLEEALAMFLSTLVHGHTNRMVQERFQRSGKTVSRWFGILLDVVSHLATDIICPHDRQFKRVSNKIKDDNRYWPYFKGCIGVIDGTHVPVVVPREMQVP
ncbi:uncharacterized protein LOC126602729 [Malus sylvestris]|uniref:uncharacterized protein LOC126602729 n=1 Tax=Malus sylvestris TaxID=3752 RepID=UPI0021AD0FDC|nr:uncharacterized protein LOC126602729 [Malus sylvestris]